MEEDTGRSLNIKCMVVGDTKIGKTHLFRAFTTGSSLSDTDYVPTVFDIFTKQIHIEGGESYTLSLWDSAGDSTYDEIRPISYPHTDCFLICYSTEDRVSFDHVESRWKPEILQCGDGPSVPLILAGLKSDLKSKSDTNCVSFDEGLTLRDKIGAVAFFEVSTKDNVDAVLQAMIESAVASKIKEDEPKDPVWGFEDIRILIVGDSTTGKSSVVRAYLGQKEDKGMHESTTEVRSHYQDMVLDGVEYFLGLIDLPSAPEYLHDRIKEYEKADGILIFYAVNDPFSFQNVENQWLPEIRKYCSKTPSIIIGNKSDLKEESNILIPTEDGEGLATSSKSAGFIECSAKTLENVEQVFLSAIKAFRKSLPNTVPHNCNPDIITLSSDKNKSDE